MKNVQLKINETGLIKNLGAIFSDRTKVIIELAQNARRAGSDSVNFFFDQEASTLTVEDSGCGIDDMQNLLSVALSGWDSDIETAESAYGMGFLATAFACDKIEITSGTKMLSANTKDILEQKTIEVIETDDAPVKGSIIKLYNFNMNEKSLNDVLKKLAKGYLINVSLNGVDFERNNNFEALSTSHEVINFEYGTLFFKSDSFDVSFNCYLQGVHILSSNTRDVDQRRVYVHLNSDVLARMPDRDKLLDEETIKKVVVESIKEYYITTLKTLQSTMDDKLFVEKYGAHVLKFCPVLFNSSNYLPNTMFSDIHEYPTLLRDFDDSYMSNSTRDISKQTILDGSVQLVELEEPCCEESFKYVMYAWLKELVVVDNVNCLDKGHWLKEHIQEVGDVEVVFNNEGKSACINGQWVYASVYFVDSYTLKGRFGEVTCDDYGICMDDGYLVIPSKENSGSSIEQVSRFTGEYGDFNEESRDNDEELLRALIMRSRCDTKAELLKKALEALPKDVIQELSLANFTLAFDKEGVIKVAEAA